MYLLIPLYSYQEPNTRNNSQLSFITPVFFIHFPCFDCSRRHINITFLLCTQKTNLYFSCVLFILHRHKYCARVIVMKMFCITTHAYIGNLWEGWFIFLDKNKPIFAMLSAFRYISAGSSFIANSDKIEYILYEKKSWVIVALLGS